MSFFYSGDDNVGSQRRCMEAAVSEERELNSLGNGQIQCCPNCGRISTAYLYLLCISTSIYLYLSYFALGLAADPVTKTAQGTFSPRHDIQIPVPSMLGSSGPQ